jgi:hypothetical protein
MNAVRDFGFPLNVYGAMLQWSEGRVDYLHYGLFEHEDEPVWQAQERASTRLWARMPPPCRVLEVGIGLGCTLQRLDERGYDVVGITPEAVQVAAVRAQHGVGLAIETTTLEAYAPAGPRFDLMLLQESAQYVQPLALFEAADRLLEPERATLLVMDEFALQRGSDAEFGLHLLPHFKALATRFGWQLVHEEDLTAQAGHTVAVLQKLTRRYACRVLDELGLAPAELAGLEQSNARYADCYRRGVFGYRLLHFERAAMPAHRPVALDANRAAAMRELFGRVFGRAMSAEEWDWKYGQGRGRGIGLADRDGRLQAFYGGLTRPLQLFGRAALGCQVCDVMVAPGLHDSLRRQGPGHRVAATFLEAEIGWGRPHAVGFGFPTARALGMAERLGLYRRVDEMTQWRWDPGTAPRWPNAASMQMLCATELQPGQPARATADRCWQAMAAGLTGAALGVRDAAWLQYRYGSKPGFTYETWLLQEPGAQPGLLVLRRHAEQLELLDLVGAPDQLARLVGAARVLAARAGLALRTWITASHAGLLRQDGDAAVRETLDLFVPANAWTPGVPPAALQGRWFLMAGDTDFR